MPVTCSFEAFDLPSVAEGRGRVSPGAKLLERLLLVLASQARRGAEGRTGDSQRSDGGSRPDGGGTEDGGRGAPGGDTEKRHFFLPCFYKQVDRIEWLVSKQAKRTKRKDQNTDEEVLLGDARRKRSGPCKSVCRGWEWRVGVGLVRKAVGCRNGWLDWAREKLSQAWLRQVSVHPGTLGPARQQQPLRLGGLAAAPALYGIAGAPTGA